ncbi:fumarate hydratase, class II [Actinobaculum suis]|uniref:Fumarate hydratase class II n=1 Tax=Actinobaculum suis TaxID=1657 RepID=A0A7Z9CA03_9ACTO|nr:class II fumarate hydratase [Actinobaculum suis]VDG76971.1 fumarate hydratase, class II [Actinobaculum suis]
MGTREEHDSLGTVKVPANRLWGAQTERSLENFPIGRPGFVWGGPLIRAFGLLKYAAAQVNMELGRLDTTRGELISRAAREVAAGEHDAEFPLVAFQTGSGTQTNMNANEVIANRANILAGGSAGTYTPVHPNDHVNRGQSSNDTFPTAMHVAIAEQLREKLYPAATQLAEALRAKEKEYANLVMTGRTHLEDATPVTLGQVFSGWAQQVDFALAAIRQAEKAVLALAIGGTAVGTGLNTHPDFGARVASVIAQETGIEFRREDNLFFALSAHDAVVELSASLRTLAGALLKIANDIRWYASGPRTGIGELHIPANEPGSSIMPGKVNPTQAEALTMVCVKVYGNDATVAFAGSQGNFQLNVYKPVMAWCTLESISLLGEAIASFTQRCVVGITPQKENIAAHLADNLMLVTALSPHIGYEAAAKIARDAEASGQSLREAALAAGISADDFDRWVDPQAMV